MDVVVADVEVVVDEEEVQVKEIARTRVALRTSQGSSILVT